MGRADAHDQGIGPLPRDQFGQWHQVGGRRADAVEQQHQRRGRGGLRDDEG